MNQQVIKRIEEKKNEGINNWSVNWPTEEYLQYQDTFPVDFKNAAVRT